ncbi:hypothetical protein [Fusobacterium hwasookii]|jgi:hypothetical protein|uniref:Uncharacterized protein n=2 Tax=Fusobacterium hwasookii TaxID=1583098 RepID=A0A0S2ZQH4_9FUSO|nr:hypothetical protein [Fusobacterium hwasookii]ALQ35383.1 hypothetical protein RN92_05590 [Fusobacterium hwasookii ChDC F206]ALQ41211.1 hypothetical protein RN87_11670 [Fusobacterium hwasookii ChDC F174]
MSGEENTKDFMDFINNISPIDNTEKKVEEKNESMESYASQSNDSLESPVPTLKNTKTEDEENITKRKNNEIILKENNLPSFQTTKEEVKDILKNIEEIKQFFSELKLNAKRDIESYTDEILSGASQQSKVLFDLMDKVLVSWQNYHAEILNKSNIKDLVTNNEKKKNNFILLYIISFLNLFFIIFLIFIIFKTK